MASFVKPSHLKASGPEKAFPIFAVYVMRMRGRWVYEVSEKGERIFQRFVMVGFIMYGRGVRSTE